MKRLTLTPTLVLVLVLTIGSAAVTGCLGGAPPPEPLNPVRFLLIGDLVGPDTVSGASDSAGLARIATVRKRIADQGPLLFVAAGGVLAGGPGPRRTSVDVLNAARLDYATFGAAELTMPADSVAPWVAASKFKWLSSNCTLPGSSGSGAANLLAWDTVRISKHKVGIFGLTLPGRSADTSRHSAASLRCSDPDSAAKRAIDTLTAQGAELIVALTSQPTTKDRDLLLRDSRVDLVLGGGEREPQTATVAERHLLKAGALARSTQFVTLWGGKDRWRQAVGRVQIDDRLPADTAVLRAQKQIPAD